MKVRVVPMSEEHLDGVLAIEQVSFPFPWTRESFLKELDNQYACYLVACSEEGVIGYAGIWLLFEEAHITTLAVKPSCRRQGVASLLMFNLFKKAFFNGALHIFLEVRISNQEARNLYEKFCFETIGKRKNYYRDEDALVMFCNLDN
ncbi:MAG: ribosomal protein S18-alanine N-acetyltransferase [Dethiobacteria bacterium]